MKISINITTILHFIIIHLLVLSPNKSMAQSRNSAPQFIFQWHNSKVVELLTKSTPSDSFLISIYPTDDDLKNNSTLFKRFKVYATPEGYPIIVDLSNFDLIKSDGKVVLNYNCLSEGASDERKNGKLILAALETHQLAIDAGIVFPSTGIDFPGPGKVEFSITESSRWSEMYTGFANLRYSHTNLGDSTTDSSPIVEGEYGYEFHPYVKPWEIPSRSFFVGVGFKTIPLTDTIPLSIRWKIMLGGRVFILKYNQSRPADEMSKIRGEWRAGIAMDRYWEIDQWRIFTDIQLEIPQIGGNYFQIFLRGKVDLPLSGNGPIDLRFSVLAGVDLSIFQTLLGKSAGTD